MNQQDQSLELARGNFEVFRKVLDTAEMKYEIYDGEAFLFHIGEGKDRHTFLVDFPAKKGKIEIRGIMFNGLDKVNRQISEQTAKLATATCAVNNILNIGSFVLDVKEGIMFFRLDYHYFDKVLEQHIVNSIYMLATILFLKYRDMFLNLIRGSLSLADFLSSI